MNKYNTFTLTVYTTFGIAYHQKDQRLDNAQDTLEYYLERYQVTRAEIWQDAKHPITIYSDDDAVFYIPGIPFGSIQ